MKVARRIAWVVLCLAALAAIGSFPAERFYASRARLIQLTEPSAEASLFGDSGTLIGSPQLIIVDDPKAVLPGRGPQGSVLVDASYLKQHGIYPLQLKTVRFFAYWVRVGSLAALLASSALILLLKRRRATKLGLPDAGP